MTGSPSRYWRYSLRVELPSRELLALGRIVSLATGLIAAANVQAGEKWLFSVYAETDALASVYQGVESPIQSVPMDSAGLIVYFPVTTGCIPYFQVLTRERAEAFQLRVDDREIEAFRWFNASEDGVVATTIAPGDEENKQELEGRVEAAYRIARELMIGNIVSAVLQPSGKTLVWRLDGSRDMINKAFEHCAASIEDQFATEQRL